DIAMHWWAKVELREKSLALTLTATETLRTLTAKHPQYRPLLARWLVWPTSEFLISLGQKQRAISHVQEAVDMYTQLNAEDPDTYGPKLAEAQKRLKELQA
ncbi:tetratricopeptide repeat protein, partial [Streptomyces longispororuber]